LGSSAKKPDHRKRIIFRPDPEIAVAPHDWISSSILQPFVTGVIVPHSVIVFVLCGNLHLLTIIKQQHDLLLSIVRGQNNALPFDSCITILWKIECYIESKGNNPVEKFIEPNGVIVLLHGFTKRSQKTPRREMELALKRMEEI
jgi:hypothetical protein